MKTKNITLMSCLAIAALLAAPASAQSPAEKTPTVDIQATAQREVQPDELTLSITIDESDYKGRATLQEKQEEMIRVLKDNKVSYEDDLTIKQMGSTATYKFFSKNPTPRTSATYYLKLYDSGTMQQVVEQLEKAKITHIDLVQTRYTREDELRTELGVEAARKAQQEAGALARAVGQTIGKAVSLSSWMSNNAPRPRVYRMVMASDASNEAGAMAKSDSAPAISGIRYTVSVSAKFELK